MRGSSVYMMPRRFAFRASVCMCVCVCACAHPSLDIWQSSIPPFDRVVEVCLPSLCVLAALHAPLAREILQASSSMQTGIAELPGQTTLIIPDLRQMWFARAVSRILLARDREGRERSLGSLPLRPIGVSTTSTVVPSISMALHCLPSHITLLPSHVSPSTYHSDPVEIYSRGRQANPIHKSQLRDQAPLSLSQSKSTQLAHPDEKALTQTGNILSRSVPPRSLSLSFTHHFSIWSIIVLSRVSRRYP